MRLDKLFKRLSDPDFQDPSKSDMYYNYYVYPYAPAEEKELEAELENFKNVLVRPNNYIDVLSLDIFEEFCNYLDSQPFGKLNPSYLKYLLKKDETMPAAVENSLRTNADKKEFYEYLNARILSHISKAGDDLKRPYVFIYGIGRIYPYLRTSVLLTSYEQYNDVSKYKILFFYPGSPRGNSYSLFNLLDDSNFYRATKIIED